MPTLNDVLAGSLQQSVQVQQVIDLLKGTPNKGVPVALTAINDQNNYALTVQNQDPVNSRALSVLKSDGTVLITADINGVTLGGPVNMPQITSAQIADGTIASVDIANQGVATVNLGPDVARYNQLTNGGLEIWQRGNGPFTTAVLTADRWRSGITGTDTQSISKDTTHQDASSVACAACTFVLGNGAGGTWFAQRFKPGDGLEQLMSKALSVSIRVNASLVGSVRTVFSPDGTVGNAVYGTANSATGYQTLTQTYTVPTSATDLWVGISFVASCTAYIDNCSLVIGSVPANYAPLVAAEDLARCLRYYEVIGGGSTTSIEVGSWCGANGQNMFVTLRYMAQKAVVPTVTRVGTWNVANCAQPTANSPDLDSLYLNIVATTAGTTAAAWNGTAGNKITLESNP
jgi:hypothetical protein